MKFQLIILTLALVMLTIPSFALSKLGDLTKFKKIAVETQVLVDRGDLVSAKNRIKDLETLWDEAEAGIKPRAGSEWRSLDKAIDRTLSELRASRLDAVACKKAIEDLVESFNQAENK